MRGWGVRADAKAAAKEARERAKARAEMGRGGIKRIPVPHVLQQVTRIGKQLVVRAVRMPHQHPVLALIHLA